VVQTRYKFLNSFVLTLLLMMSCGFQTSLWFQITGGAPAPQLWLLILLYISLYRPYFFAMGFIYFLTVVIKSFSAVPLGILWCCFFVIVSLSAFVKSRLFWSSTRYFIIASFCFSLFFNICFLALSHFVEDNPAGLSLFTRMSEILLTTLFSGPMYWLLIQIDRATLPEVMESTRVEE